MGRLLPHYTLGSDPALWSAGERRERELIMHDKGYYHSYIEEALVTTTPDHPQALVPLPKTPARATALPAIVKRGGPAAVFAAEQFFYAAMRHDIN